MNWARYLWKYSDTKKIYCELQQINTTDTHVSLTLQLENMDSLDNEKLSFVLLERTTKETYESKMKSELNEDGICLLHTTISVKDLPEGIWDAYVYIKNEEGNVIRVRVVNTITSELHIKPLFNEALELLLYPYETVNKNLSFKYQPKVPFLHFEDVRAIEADQLYFKGAMTCYLKQDAKIKHINKSILAKTSLSEEEFRFPLENIGTSLWDFAGTISLFSQPLHDVVNKRITFSVEYEIQYEDGTTDIERAPIQLVHLQNFELMSLFEEGLLIDDRQINFYQSKRDVWAVVHDVLLNVEVDTVYCEENNINITCNVYPNDVLQNGEYQFIIKRRFIEKMYKIPVVLQDGQFTVQLDILELVETGQLSIGTWDLYLGIDEEKRARITSYLDGVEGKQKIISYPQQIVRDDKDFSLAVKPFYTRTNDLSILVRPFVSFKQLQHISFEGEKCLINSKIVIHESSIEIPEETKGEVVVSGAEGVKKAFPAVIQLTFTKKSRVEYTAKWSIDISKADQKWLLENIDFDSWICNIMINNIKVPYLMNVEPAKVIETPENRLAIKRGGRYVGRIGLKIYNWSKRFLPVNDKVYIFQSYYGKSYSCNPKAIYEELLKEGRDFKGVWVINDLHTEIPGDAILVRPRSWKYYYYMAIGKYFINNANFPDFYIKREGQVHLQTWHGTPLKRLGLDVDKNSEAYKENSDPKLLARIRRWDYLVAPNDYTGDILKRAYQFEKEVLRVGYPRNDIFYRSESERNEIAEKTRKKLNIPKDKKVILYAPTWRDYDRVKGSGGEPYKTPFDLDQLIEQFGEEYVLLLRLHYFDANRVQLNGYENKVYNVASYDDIQELYLISDLLITDYSSVMYDYANLNRPIIFYTYDLERYGSQIRGFYVDFEAEAPGPLVLTEEELFERIATIHNWTADYEEKYKEFSAKYCNLEDGHAAQRVISKVFTK